ncbi:FAD-dependent oxidoreductase [Acidovorax sp. DW039]|uniref:FAD-dependent oxidoreductase n=1 Tax=Acidovorax sp. DW039 TaxID=3095606 RepID=UPI00308B18DA|nr:FAD-dependent oxidoreductase [Acidovorax sp. DW039]
MKIAIVGAGIAGVTTAYELAQDGHEVTVLDQRSAAAEESSFANGGLLGPCLSIPGSFARKGGLGALEHWSPKISLRLAQGAGLQGLVWRWRWSGSRTPIQTLESMARYSAERTANIATRHELDFDATQGRMLLFRSAKERTHFQPAIDWLREAGTPLEDISPDKARQLEPGLSPEAPLDSAVLLPRASAGNCRLFAQLLRQGLQTAGVQFCFGSQITRLATQPTEIHIASEPIPRRFDAVVLCTGSATAALLKPLGIKLPMAAVYGYSVSAPLREATHAPLASAVDMQRQITITRQGQRIRITGGYELGAHDAPHHHPSLQQLYQTINDWFPGGAQLSSQLQIWRGARPTLPDAAPIVGASGIPGLWINAGHGAAGWALACGSARATADLIAQRNPDISLQGFEVGRF